MVPFLLVSWAFPVRGGDPDLAKFMLKGGKEDFAKRRYSEALVKFEKARTEDPGLIEATYWAATALEAKKDLLEAMARYRDFRESFEAKKRTSRVSTDEVSLASKAQARIDALAGGELELKRLREAFAVDVLSFVRANFARDIVMARRALKMLLDEQPESAEAKALLAKLDPSQPPPIPEGRPSTPSPLEDLGGPARDACARIERGLELRGQDPHDRCGDDREGSVLLGWDFGEYGWCGEAGGDGCVAGGGDVVGG